MSDHHHTRTLAPLTGADDEGVILVAKSAIALVGRFRAWRHPPALIDCSRLEPRPMRWLVPLAPTVRRVAILKRQASTGLTQRRVARWLANQRPDLEITFGCETAETRLGAMQQHWRIADDGLVAADWCAEALPHRYLVALVGYPGCGKSFLRRLLAVDSEVAVLRWGAWAAAHASRLTGAASVGLPEMRMLYAHLERSAPALLALTALTRLKPATHDLALLVVDGIKNLDQLATLAYGTQRPPIIVAVTRDESERQRIVAQRGHSDDGDDAARMELLRLLGLDNVMAMADVTIDSTGCRMEWDRRSGAWVRLTVTERFCTDIAALWALLGWRLAVPVEAMLAWRCAAAMPGSRHETLGIVTGPDGRIRATRRASPVTPIDALDWTVAQPHSTGRHQAVVESDWHHGVPGPASGAGRSG